ncbi:unnamed protein product [Caenorhabditis brenneri]
MQNLRPTSSRASFWGSKLQGLCGIFQVFGPTYLQTDRQIFRRTASQKSQPQGLDEDENCTIFEGGMYKCKKCRLKKCFAMGMSTEKFQTHRDPLSSTTTYKKRSLIPQSLSNFLGRPEFILCCEPDKISHIKTTIDVSWLIDKAKTVFLTESVYSSPPLKFDNSLEKLAFAMEDSKMKNVKSEKTVMKYIGQIEYTMFWETTFLAAAHWFAEIPEFQELDMEVKLEILKSTWMLRARLEKLAETADYQRKQLMDSNLYILTEDTCLDLEKVEVDLRWCTNYSTEQMRFYLLPDSENHWKESIDLLINLEPTSIELNFMLIQLCLSDAGRRNHGKVLEATERLLQTQANNLHDYYTKNLKTPHYSERLIKMMKVNKSIELDVRARREKNHLAKLFDVFSVDFSHPEMFDLT